MYAKLGGKPWTVDHDLPVTDEMLMGMWYCELWGSRFEERQRFVGITMVFQGDGNYLLGHISGECSYDKYPEHPREATRDVLDETRRRNGWNPRDRIRIIFHIYKPLKKVEISSFCLFTRMPAARSRNKKRTSDSLLASGSPRHARCERGFRHRQQGVHMREDMNPVTFALVNPAAIVFQARSLKTISVAFYCFLLVLAVCPFTQFTDIVFEIFVNA